MKGFQIRSEEALAGSERTQLQNFAGRGELGVLSRHQNLGPCDEESEWSMENCAEGGFWLGMPGEELEDSDVEMEFLEDARDNRDCSWSLTARMDKGPGPCGWTKERTRAEPMNARNAEFWERVAFALRNHHVSRGNSTKWKLFELKNVNETPLLTPQIQSMPAMRRSWRERHPLSPVDPDMNFDSDSDLMLIDTETLHAEEHELQQALSWTPAAISNQGLVETANTVTSLPRFQAIMNCSRSSWRPPRAGRRNRSTLYSTEHETAGVLGNGINHAGTSGVQVNAAPPASRAGFSCPTPTPGPSFGEPFSNPFCLNPNVAAFRNSDGATAMEVEARSRARMPSSQTENTFLGDYFPGRIGTPRGRPRRHGRSQNRFAAAPPRRHVPSEIGANDGQRPGQSPAGNSSASASSLLYVPDEIGTSGGQGPRQSHAGSSSASPSPPRYVPGGIGGASGGAQRSQSPAGNSSASPTNVTTDNSAAHFTMGQVSRQNEKGQRKRLKARKNQNRSGTGG